MPAAVYLMDGSRSVLVDRGGGDLPVHTFKTHSVGIGVIACHVPHFNDHGIGAVEQRCLAEGGVGCHRHLVGRHTFQIRRPR